MMGKFFFVCHSRAEACAGVVSQRWLEQRPPLSNAFVLGQPFASNSRREAVVGLISTNDVHCDRHLANKKRSIDDMGNLVAT